MKTRRYAAVAVVFGNCADRYVLQGYTEPRSFDQMLEDAKQVPGLTGGDPASLSPAAYNLLRGGGYGGPPFGGVVFTDDLSSMGAINQRYGVAEAVLRALQAGADVALWVTTGEVPAVLDRLESAVHAGELSEQRVEDSVTKLAGAKGTNPHC